MESQRRRRILIVDDDGAVQVSLALLLKQSGFDTLCADGPRQALDRLHGGGIDLVLQDMNFSLQTSGDEGLDLLARVRASHPGVPVLLMTAWGSIALAVQGMQAGAANFFTKPWDNGQLVALIEATLQLAAPPAARQARAALEAGFDFSAIVGEHPRLLKVLETVGQVARTRAPVLILGESGTGKELVADAIHHNSPRAARPIVKINMGAITPSLFESEMFGHVRGAFTDARADRKGHVASAIVAVRRRNTRLGEFIDCFTKVVKMPAPELRPTRLRDVMDDILWLNREQCASRGIALGWGQCDEVAPLPLDVQLIEQTLLNIVKNAVEAIGRDGAIRVELQDRCLDGHGMQERVRLSVVDSGGGLDAGAARRLFTPFYTTKKDGQGIGLMFVREVLVRHGCTYALTPGGGGETRFDIWFPAP